MGSSESALERYDFFISYATSDNDWAQWVAWQLEHCAGYRVFFQAWDFRPGHNFVVQMHRAAERSARTIIILSPAFLESEYVIPEWASVLATDPSGDFARLVPIRVREVEPPGLLRGVIWIDLVGLDITAARETLLDGVRSERAKPATEPEFPGVADQGPRKTSPELPTSSGPAIWNVPSAPLIFEGRGDLLRVLAERDDQVAPSQTQVRIVHRRWLLVFDDAPDAHAIAELIPAGQHGCVLVTSRRAGGWGAVGQSHPLTVWHRHESIRYLQRRAGASDEQAADALAAALGDLPLALEQAGGYMDLHQLSPTAYLERLRSRPLAVLLAVSSK